MSTRFVTLDRDTPMMLPPLVYCYATGRFSSREIEAATYGDAAVR
jgi:hypothetical protein